MDESLLIVGTGAMACLFAARLSAAGVGVMMLGAWQEGLEALRAHGVRVMGGDGGERVYPVQVADDPVGCAGARYALVLVKSWQTSRAARQLAECLSPEAAQQRIQETARRAVERLQAGDAPEPLRLQLPVTLTVQLARVEMAEKASIVPGAASTR